MITTKSWVKYEEKEKNNGEFIIQPLSKGMGLTIGNSLRRILLSSLPGSAITGVKIKGITHEFTTLPNVVEDVLEIICNLKSVIIAKESEEDEVLKLNVKGKKNVKASDLECPAGLKILNKDQHLFALGERGEVELEVYVSSGYGYVRAMNGSNSDEDVELINIDASFSPTLRVNHEIQSIRVGKELGYDLLKMEVKTNGTMNPEEALLKSINIFREHFVLFDKINEEPQADEEEKDLADEKLQNILNMSIDDLELSARSSNCLKRAGIEKVSELLEKDMEELIKIKNFGKKSADEINGKLMQYNLSLKEA